MQDTIHATEAAAHARNSYWRFFETLKYGSFVIAISFLYEGLWLLTSGKTHVNFGWPDARSIPGAEMWWPLPFSWRPGDTRLASASVHFFIGAVLLYLPILADLMQLRQRGRELGVTLQTLRTRFGPSVDRMQMPPSAADANLVGHQIDLEMNARLWILQTFLTVSVAFSWVHLTADPDFDFVLKLPIRIGFSLAVVGFLKYLKLVPSWCHLWSGFSPWVMYRVLRNRVPGVVGGAAMAAVIGIDQLGIAYAMIFYPLFSDPVFIVGSLFLVLFAWKGWRVKGSLILLGWIIINCGYTLDGVANTVIDYVGALLRLLG